MDPFEFAKNELTNDSLSVCKAYYDRFKQLTSSSSVDSEQIEWTRSELRQHLDTTLSELEELEETVNIVESKPSQYHLPAEEIKNRRKFINETKEYLDRILNHVNEYTPIKKFEAKKRKEEREELLHDRRDFSTGKDRYDLYDEQITRDNDAFIQQQMLRQREVIEEQDKNLDRVIEGTSRLKNLVLDIGDELDQHSIIIEELNTEVGRTNSNITRASRRLDKLLKSAGGDMGKIILIVILFIILGVLVLLVTFL